MMTRSPTNKRTTVRFGGPEDDSTRSAWKSANRSFQPPSPAQRKATIGMDTLEKTRAAAALVAALDAGSNHEPLEKDDTTAELVSLLKPSSLKTRSKTVPILKTTKEDSDLYDYNQNFPMEASRSAWKTAETRHSFRSVMGPSPAQRQKTLEEADLRDVCASVAAMHDSSSSVLRDMSTRDSSARSYRGTSTRSNSIKDVSIQETPIDTQESIDSEDSGF